MNDDKEKKIHKGSIWIGIGLLFLIAALLLACYNIWDESRANEVRASVLEQILPELEKEEIISDYKKFPDMAMPETEIDGNRYIGVLNLPSLDLELPVMSEWSYPKLKVAPCRYEGSAYLGNLIIAAHNYDCHFGNLNRMAPGDEVIFTDTDGNRFVYEVSEIEIINSYGVEEMESGEWDLTLFTCTYGGRERVTVRCVLVQ